MQRFSATAANRRCAVFLFNLPALYQIDIDKSPFTGRDDWFENLGETTALACDVNVHFLLPSVAKKRCVRRLAIIFLFAARLLMVSESTYVRQVLSLAS